MRTSIVYHSEHHGNTEKIAKSIAPILGATLTASRQADPGSVLEADLIGFGSGIYYGKFHQNITNLVEHMPEQAGKRCFIFSTTGSKRYSRQAHELFSSLLSEKGFKIIGEFSCPGFDTALSSEGVNRGRPNDEDIREAEDFAEKLKSKI
jgi:flavodoxin